MLQNVSRSLTDLLGAPYMEAVRNTATTILGLDPAGILGAQTAGGAIGNTICPPMGGHDGGKIIPQKETKENGQQNK